MPGSTWWRSARADVYVVPFQRELADLDALLASATAQAKSLPGAYALLGELAAIQSHVPSYRDQVAAAGTLADVGRRELRDALRGEIGRLRQLDGLTRAALAHRDEGPWPVQLAAANPWAPYGGLDEVLEGRMEPGPVQVAAFQGETESAAVNAVNWSPKTRTVRVEVADFVSEGQEAVRADVVVRLHEVVDVPAQTLDLSADALPLMNQGKVWTLPGWDGRQLWLTVNTDALAPGTWTSTVNLRSLEVESTTFAIPLTVEVWNTALADTNVLKHCNWGYVSRSRLAHHEEASIADRIDHGNNVFVSTFLPRATYDETGNLAGTVDYGSHDDFVKKYAPHGMILFHNNHPITTEAPRDSEAYQKAYVHYVREWVKHLADLGVGYDGFAMYPIDEPGLRDGLVEAYLHNAKTYPGRGPQGADVYRPRGPDYGGGVARDDSLRGHLVPQPGRISPGGRREKTENHAGIRGRDVELRVHGKCQAPVAPRVLPRPGLARLAPRPHGHRVLVLLHLKRRSVVPPPEHPGLPAGLPGRWRRREQAMGSRAGWGGRLRHARRPAGAAGPRHRRR